MKWFLILLFWNPLHQDFRLPEGWDMPGADTYEECEARAEFAEMNLQQYVPDTVHLIA